MSINLKTFASLSQISVLINHKDSSFPRSDKASAALVRVGQVVNGAVEKFVQVGETIADENPEIMPRMHEACRLARNSGLCVIFICALCGEGRKDRVS